MVLSVWMECFNVLWCCITHKSAKQSGVMKCRVANVCCVWECHVQCDGEDSVNEGETQHSNKG